jgi:hypothetical protein
MTPVKKDGKNGSDEKCVIEYKSESRSDDVDFVQVVWGKVLEELGKQ